MANGSGLVKISSEEDYLPNCFSKGAVKEYVLYTLIPITTNTFLATFPIFPSQIVFSENYYPLYKPEKDLYLKWNPHLPHLSMLKGWICINKMVIQRPDREQAGLC
jgi:hypothetical protein